MPAKHTDSCDCNNKHFEDMKKIHNPITLSGYTNHHESLLVLCYPFHVRSSHSELPTWFHMDMWGEGGKENSTLSGKVNKYF